MNKGLHVTEEAPNIGPLANPLAHWPNDDLLLREASRERLATLDPEALEVLDWPALRDAFCAHEPHANRARRTNLRSGVTTIVLSGLGLCLVAAAPLGWELPVRAVAEIALILGFALGLWHLVWARPRSEWLLHRFWTERIRQFYFQFMINNLDAAAAALTDVTARSDFLDRRDHALKVFLTTQMHDVSDKIDLLIDDEAEMSPWLDAAWEHAAPLGPDNAGRNRLIAALGRQRLGIQLEYTRKKLRPGIHSPRTRAESVIKISDLLTGCVVLLGILTCAVIFDGVEPKSPWFIAWTSLGALCSAAIVVLRLLDQGLQLRVDAERFGWYHAAVKALHARFENALSIEDKRATLRELEHLSYQELRRFIVAHKSARFLL